MPSTTERAAPPQGQGYYDLDHSRWWDSHVGYFLPLALGADRLEVRAEEVRDGSGLARRFPRAARLLRAPRYRFVGEAASDDPRWPSYRIVGESFSTGVPRILRGRLDDRPWAPGPRQHLNDFVSYLFERGWQPESHGGPWWSLQLTRPCVNWPESATLGAASEPVGQRGSGSFAVAA
jgi:hypothetical protein